MVLAYWTTAYLVSEQSSVIARNDRIIFKSPYLLILMAKCLTVVYMCLAIGARSIFEKDDLGRILTSFFPRVESAQKRSRCQSSNLPLCRVLNKNSQEQSLLVEYADTLLFIEEQ